MNFNRTAIWRMISGLTCSVAMLTFARFGAAATTFQISYQDPTGSLNSLTSSLNAHILAAANEWSSHFEESFGSLEILVVSDTTVPRATGRSLTSSFVGTVDGFFLYEMGAAAKMQTGIDPNSTAFDVEITFNPGYANNELWFDPDPLTRTAPVPSLRTDAMSVILHELGHALGINGWLDALGNLPGDYMSTFDAEVATDGDHLYFVGANAQREYGGPVPITVGVPSHIGNFAPNPGTDLLGDLMNGVQFLRGSRYSISQLDLALLADTGLPIIGFNLLGDLNDDGGIDGADLGLLFSAWGLVNSTADLNGDGSVDGADVGILYDGWTGDSADFHSAIQSVPEPAVSASLLVIFVAAATRRSAGFR
ncbi:MAG: hypothetical protein O2931_00795 [Planctomycetota bacterium]|nr:hypothetical protein [Planctomycetota bacterium]MDA1177310.1 hypothetical protein [Planctomycetota bacterium]